MIGHKNLLTACFAALLALGLVACGTTGDNAPAADLMDDDKDDDKMDDGAGAGLVGSACDDGLASRACVEARELALDGANDALVALEADKDSTLGQIDAAKLVIDAATTALAEARTAWYTYQAKQPPTYNVKAMAEAVDMPAECCRRRRHCRQH